MISQKVLSYSDFLSMPYNRFKQVEATYYFMLKLKNDSLSSNSSNTKDKKSNLKDQANRLSTISKENLPKEHLEILK